MYYKKSRSQLIFILILLIQWTFSVRIWHNHLSKSCRSTDLKIPEESLISSFKVKARERNFFRNKETEKKLLSLLRAKISKIKGKEQNCWFLRSGRTYEEDFSFKD